MHQKMLSVPAIGWIVLMALAHVCHAADRPNVIVIMTDDQGYGDFGVMGNELIQTPNLDAMAAGSAGMETFYVSPVCSPTRACLMTGRYNYRTRCIDTFVGRSTMDPEEVTIAEVLQDAGYVTGIFGKWHLGDHYPSRAMDQGFEETLVIRGGGIGQPPDPVGGEGKYTDPVLFHNGQQVQTKGYCTDVFFSHAMDWIEQCRRQDRNFFAYIPTNAPHGPFHDVPEALYQQYRKMDFEPIMIRRRKAGAGRDESDTLARIFAMITNVDENVGRLFRKLDSLEILDNTVVIFLTDNGPNTLRYVGPMRGMKSNVHDGGIRTVFWMHWPARLKAGHRSDRLAAHIDVMPTLLEACQVDKPADLRLDGRSFLPLLTGNPVDWPDRTLFIQTHRGDVPERYHHFAARSQRWKLVNPSGFGRETLPGAPQFELYDVLADPGEKQNLANEHPAIVKRMKEAYEAWFKDVSSTRPDNYAPPRIHVGTPFENPVVLTRQDWRHMDGRPWAPDSNGQWMLYVAATGQYDIRARFPTRPADGQAELVAGDQHQTATFKAGATQLRFSGLELPVGNIELKITLTSEGKSEGPLQVDFMAP